MVVHRSVEEAKAVFESQMAAVKRLAQRKLLSKEEVEEKALQAQEVFLEGIDRRYSSLHLSSDQWDQLVRDYHSWRNHEEYQADDESTWCSDAVAQHFSSLQEAKDDFFQTRSLCCAGIASFEPIPEEMPHPAIWNSFAPHKKTFLPFPSEEVDEMYSLPRERVFGEHSFTSTNQDVLHIDVQGVSADAELIGYGYIEGYMLPTSHKLTIVLNDQDPEPCVWFSWHSEEDAAVQRSNPKHSAYYTFLADRECRIRSETYQLLLDSMTSTDSQN